MKFTDSGKFFLQWAFIIKEFTQKSFVYKINNTVIFTLFHEIIQHMTEQTFLIWIPSRFHIDCTVGACPFKGLRARGEQEHYRMTKKS